MNSLKLKLVIIACAIMNTTNSFTSTNNSKKNEKKRVLNCIQNYKNMLE